MQTYSPRDPVREYIAGTLSHADLRVMIAHLGPDTPWGRERNGPWSQTHRLLHSIDTQLRYLRADLAAIVTRQPREPDLYPLPEPTERQLEALAAEAEVYREEQEDLLRTLTDPARRDRQERTTTEE